MKKPRWAKTTQKCAQIAKKWPNMAPRPSPREHIQILDGLRWPCRLIILARKMKERAFWYEIQHAGGRTPAHCDASRISAGVHFRESALARRNHAKHFQNLPTMCSKGPKSFKISPQTLPKPPQNPPKATPNPSTSPFGAHFEPMLERSSILNVQKTAKRLSKAPKGGPRRPQTPPKCSPRPSQNWFLLDF